MNDTEVNWVLLIFAAEQGEAGEASQPVGAVLPALGSLPHAFRLDRHPPDEHRQQRRQSGEGHGAGDESVRSVAVVLCRRH